MQARNPQHAKGVDVSSYQGDIDWGKVRAAGISFAFVKATEGTTIADAHFAANAAGAKYAGLAVGIYHFLRAASTADAQNEAAFFVKTVRDNGGFDRFALPPVLDMEVDNGLAREALTAIARTWLEAVEAASGRQPVLYTYPYFADTYLDASLGQVPLWLANYDTNQPADHGGWTIWTFLQYTDKGTVPGIAGPVDLDEYNGTEEELSQMPINLLSPDDANEIIRRWIAYEYDLASDADKAERHRLANELRKASGQPEQNP